MSPRQRKQMFLEKSKPSCPSYFRSLELFSSRPSPNAWLTRVCTDRKKVGLHPWSHRETRA